NIGPAIVGGGFTVICLEPTDCRFSLPRTRRHSTGGEQSAQLRGQPVATGGACEVYWITFAFPPIHLERRTAGGRAGKGSPGPTVGMVRRGRKLPLPLILLRYRIDNRRQPADRLQATLLEELHHLAE